MASNLDKFYDECKSCLHELRSLDEATQKAGVVGFDAKSRKFYPTTFSNTEAYAGKSVSKFMEQRYQSWYGASPEGTLHELDQLKNRIKVFVSDANTLLEDPSINPSDKEKLSEKLQKVITQMELTRENGVKKLLDFYADSKTEKTLTRDTMRIEEYSKLYEEFTADQDVDEILAKWDPKATRKEKIAAEVIQLSKLSKENLKNCLYPQDASNNLTIPNSTVEDSKRDAYRVLAKKETGKKNLEVAALKQNNFLDAPEIHVQNKQAVWKAYRLQEDEDGSFQTTENATFSNPEGQRAGDLPNIRIQNDPSIKHSVITCAAINTKQKADEFIEILLQQLEQRGANDEKMPLRVCLHQLNSYGQINVDVMGWNLINSSPFGEKALIINQHKMSRYIERELRKELTDDFCKKHILEKPKVSIPIVTHDNTSFNIASQLNKGEDQINQLISLEGYAARALWAHKAIEKEFPEAKLGDLMMCMNKLTLMRQRVMKAKENPDLDNKKLQKIQNRLRDDLKELTELIREVAKETPNARLTFIADVLSQAIPQGALDTRVRVTEVERNFLFDLMIDAITEINCKSGLDRTGLARALWDSMISIYKEVKAATESDSVAFEALIDLLNKQDAMSAENNRLMNEFINKKQIAIMDDLEKPVAQYSGNFRNDYLEYMKEQVDDPQKRNDLIRALHYQDLVAYHLLTVSLPVTQEGTGVLGLKYSHQAWVGANPHPLNRFPMIMQTEDGQLIRNFHPVTGAGWTDWMGHNMTKACIAIFERLSPARGA